MTLARMMSATIVRLTIEKIRPNLTLTRCFITIGIREKYMKMESQKLIYDDCVLPMVMTESTVRISKVF